MKIVISSIICVILGYLGLFFNNIYKTNYIFIEQWDKYIEQLLREITFLKKPLGEITNEYILDKKGPFIDILVKFDCYINNNSKDDLIKFVIKNSPSKKISETLLDFFNNLGNLDYTNQINYINSIKVLVIEYKNKAKVELKTKGSVLKKIGILVGIAMMIIMV